MDLLSPRLIHSLIIFYSERNHDELNPIEMTESEDPKSPRINT